MTSGRVRRLFILLLGLWLGAAGAFATTHRTAMQSASASIIIVDEVLGNLTTCHSGENDHHRPHGADGPCLVCIFTDARVVLGEVAATALPGGTGQRFINVFDRMRLEDAARVEQPPIRGPPG